MTKGAAPALPGLFELTFSRWQLTQMESTGFTRSDDNLLGIVAHFFAIEGVLFFLHRKH